VQQHGSTVAGKKIQIIRKDVGGINPPTAKRLAQELVVRDKVPDVHDPVHAAMMKK
jgi:branched-chain amino acid transport system substrate-binding protein